MKDQIFSIYKAWDNITPTFEVKLLAVSVDSQEVNFVYYKVNQQSVDTLQEERFDTSEHQSFEEFYKVFCDKNQLKLPDIVSIAVAGPVIDGKCNSDKLAWTLDIASISKNINVEKVFLINDAEAIAYSICCLKENQLKPIHESNNRGKANMAILTPGKGLGEAGLFWDGEFLRPFATEGGHTEFSPRTDWEVEFYQYLKKIYSIVSWETVLSEDGLFNIYRFLRDVKHHEEPVWLTEKLSTDDKFSIIVEVALQKKVRICNIALGLFVEFLAREANNLVLKLKATGGLLITGKVSNMISDLLNKDKFYKDFIISDKMESLLENVPIYLVEENNDITLGAAVYGAFVKN